MTVSHFQVLIWLQSTQAGFIATMNEVNMENIGILGAAVVIIGTFPMGYYGWDGEYSGSCDSGHIGSGGQGSF